MIQLKRTIHLMAVAAAVAAVTILGCGGPAQEPGPDLVPNDVIPGTRFCSLTLVVEGPGVLEDVSGLYTEGAVVTLTATPDSGCRLHSWQGADDEATTELTNTVAMTDDRIVTATFETIPGSGSNSDPTPTPDPSPTPTPSPPPTPPGQTYALTVEVIGSGTLSPNGGRYAAGKVVPLTAVPNSGHAVTRWTGTNDDNSTSTNNAVTMNADRLVKVEFKPTGGPAPTPSPTPGPSPTPTPANPTPTPSPTGTPTPTPSPSPSPSPSPTPEPTPTPDPTPSPPPPPPPGYHSLTATVAAGQGSVSPDYAVYEEGTVATVTAAPAEGYGVMRWTGTDDDASTARTNTVTMDADKTVTVEFEPRPWAATPLFSPGGQTFRGSIDVSISCDTPDAQIFYTTNGSPPGLTSPEYTEPLTLTSTTVLKAVAYHPAMELSAIAEATFTELPSVELTLHRVSDITGIQHTADPGQPQTVFAPGETARVTLTAANVGGAFPALCTLVIAPQTAHAAPIYDSHDPATTNSTEIEDVSGGLTEDDTQYYSFDLVIPETADGPYDLLGSIRHADSWPTLYETTLAGPDTTDVETAWIAALEVTPEGSNTEPTAAFLAATSVLTVYVDASSSTDPQDALGELAVRWDWTDDGTWDTDWTTVKTGSHAYETLGTYTVRLEVRDSGGLSNQTTRNVTLTGGASTITIPCDETSVEMQMVRIAAGSFVMGAPTGIGWSDEHPQHTVQITKPFYVGKFEVTQKQYHAVMGVNPSQFIGNDRPVEKVSWFDAKTFCQRLSDRTGRTVRLPTEAEWEYACRAGGSTNYCYGDDPNQLGSVAWFGENSADATHVVGGKDANAWGLHDLHGNVWEWCADWYDADYYQVSPQNDPAGPPSGAYRVLRGGSFLSIAYDCRASGRDRSRPLGASYSYGFRVVFTD